MSLTTLVLPPAARGLVGREGECTAGAEGLVLEQVVAHAAKVDAPLDGVVAADLGPVVDEVDVGFGPDPGHGS